MTKKTSANDVAKRLEETHKLNSYLRRLIERLSDIFILLDRDTNILYCSNALLDLMEIDDADEFRGRPFINVFKKFKKEDFIQRCVGRLSHLIAGEDEFTEDDDIPWPNGDTRSYRITYSRIRDESNDFEGIAIVLMDVTALRLEEAKRRISGILHSSLLPCMVWDEAGNVLAWNKETNVVFGIPTNFLPEKYAELFFAIHPPFQPEGRSTEALRQEFIKDALHRGFARLRIHLQKVDGTPLYLGVSAARLMWQSDYRLIVYYHDLTEVSLKEAAAHEAEERIQLMLNNVPMACILRDEHNHVIDCNEEALKVFGVPNKDAFLGNFTKFYPEFQPDGSRSIDRATEILDRLREDGVISNFEWTFQTIEGKLLPVETTLIRIPRKGVYHCLSYSRDLREAKANEQRMLASMELNLSLEMQREAAQAASEAKSLFMATMSHEMRTPLNSIIGFLDLLRTDNLDAEQIGSLGVIKHVSQHLLQIVNDILDVQKIESDRLELLPIHFDFHLFCNDLVAQHRHAAETSGLQFESSLAPDLPPTVFGDEVRIRQIVTNLLSNAVKYTPKGKVAFNVDSTVEDGREFITFSVADTGVGIKEENFAILFEKFERVDLHKHHNITGSGLGLSIVKRLVNLMDGHVRLQSEYGEGSEFTVLLPLIKGDADKIVKAEEFERIMAKSDTKVLVVDDNPGNITVVVGLLARHGIVPDTTDNGPHAIEMIRTHRYDLVFMDHMMPEMDGVDATIAIRHLDGEYYRTLPIIALSANVTANAQELFFNNGMNDFVSKPIISGVLNRALGRWLPPDKILPKEPRQTEPKPSEPPMDDALLNKQLDELRKINDLSITSGLARVDGDRQLYVDVLRKFCQGATEDISVLKQCVKEGLWKAYGVRVHAIKSVLAIIGNQFLADWAANLEQAVELEKTDKCAKENNNFCTHLTTFHTLLLRTDLMADIAALAKRRKISLRALRKELELLRAACDDFQPEAAEPIAKRLLGVTHSASVDATLAKIHDLVYSFDFDKAIGLVDELMKSF